MSSMFVSEKEIFDHLRDLGCCEICSVRYFCNKFIDLGDVNSYLQKNNISELNDDTTKKIKPNPCTVCLGLLQTPSIDQLLTDSKLKDALKYDSKVFTCSISMPACILLREHSMRLHLEEKFPNFFIDDRTEIPLNRAWKMFVRKPLAEHLQKQFESSETCEFSINISFDHQNDESELTCLKLMHPKVFEQRIIQRRKFQGELFARKCVVSVLEEIDRKIFNEHYSVPPNVAANFVCLKSVECKHNPIYFAGRYIKYSRELPQSPWIIEGKRMLESSIQEIIFQGVLKIFQIDENSLRFSASGREDCDVRCLGSGRPFYIEISNPTKHFTREDFKSLEVEINKSRKIQVKYLQSVEKSELAKVKEGEESKTKNYEALCRSRNPVTQEQIDKINCMGLEPMVIEQETPIRVLHRRPLATRKRTIHEMKAEKIEGYPDFFRLFLVTQAGTYVKEFVHGDFNRTHPNISQIIGNDSDIIALDVVSINLDWPSEIID